MSNSNSQIFHLSLSIHRSVLQCSINYKCCRFFVFVFPYLILSGGTSLKLLMGILKLREKNIGTKSRLEFKQRSTRVQTQVLSNILYCLPDILV